MTASYVSKLAVPRPVTEFQRERAELEAQEDATSADALPTERRRLSWWMLSFVRLPRMDQPVAHKRSTAEMMRSGIDLR